MQPALSTPFAQSPIPAWGELSEKPRLGFTSKNPALHLGQSVCNSTTALGFEAALHLNRVRSRCSAEQYDPDLGLYDLRARYMNPVTGRFMSRDPNEPQVRDANGTPLDPRKLHKYLYASGDPVNRIDPRGREDAEEEVGAGAEALDNLESIEGAQQRIRSGADGGKRIIDVIQKSLDRVGHLLDRITQGDYDPDDWE